MRTSKAMTAAIYARVSTEDQKYEMQLHELKAYAARMGWQIVEYVEKASSGKLRPVFERLLSDARLRKFDVVLVWKIDRFARSTKQFLDSVLALDNYGIRFIAVTQNIDTDQQNPMGKFLMHILAAVAELERSIIVDRVRAGVAEAKRQGKHCGRPARVFPRDQAAKLRAAGWSWRAMERKLGIPQATLRLALKNSPKPGRKPAKTGVQKVSRKRPR